MWQLHVAGIAARQVRNLLEDVRKEVDRRHAGEGYTNELWIFVCKASWRAQSTWLEVGLLWNRSTGATTTRADLCWSIESALSVQGYLFWADWWGLLAADKERNKPHPSTSAAPLASLSFRLQPCHVAVQQYGSGLIITRRVPLRNPGRRTSCTR